MIKREFIVMKWNKYTIKTTTEATDYICGLLVDIGINGAQVEDNRQLTEEEKAQQYVDILADLPEDDGTAYVSFYTNVDRHTGKSDDEELLETIRAALKEASSFLNVGEGSIEHSTTQEEDWINNWKKYFKSFTCGDFYIKPTWQKRESEYDSYKMIEMDPGTAFGTGKHDTTQLCIKNLCKYVKSGDKVLDLGCGSGILSIVAKMLDASRIDMNDIDEAAVRASKENFEMNHLSLDNVNIACENVIDDEVAKAKYEEEKYDVVVANILADVIIPIAGFVDKFLKPGAIFISSGIIYMKEDDVKKAIEENGNLEVVEVTKQGDWVSIVAKRKDV